MDKRLIDAAMKGDVEKLQNLIKHDPFILHTAALEEGDTLLHLACIGSHLDFVKEILALSPELAGEISTSGLTPLHVACARGNVEIVRELLKVGSDLCLVKGKEGRIPLHTAVAKGRVAVIRELVSACLDSIVQVSARGETCFHVAVKYCQFEAFKVLCELLASSGDAGILNCGDERGNTVLHLAASTKQYEVFDLLLKSNSCFKGVVVVNSLNKKKITASDILVSEGGDSDIEEILVMAGAAAARAPSTSDTRVPSQPSSSSALRPEHRRACRLKSASLELQEYFKYDKARESPSTARNTLLVITVLIVTATYQAVLSPPGGVWQDDWPDVAAASAKNSSSNVRPMPSHKAGQSVMGSKNYVSYGLFLLFNSVGFFMSLHMMNFLTLGLPLQFELRVALLALTATYDTCMVAIAPAGRLSMFFIVISVMMPFIMILLTKVVRDFKKERRCESRSATVPV